MSRSEYGESIYGGYKGFPSESVFAVLTTFVTKNKNNDFVTTNMFLESNEGVIFFGRLTFTKKKKTTFASHLYLRQRSPEPQPRRLLGGMTVCSVVRSIGGEAKAKMRAHHSRI